MAEFDDRLIKQLQEEVGRRRQEGATARRYAHEPEPEGDDLRQQIRTLVQDVVTAYEAARLERGEQEWRWEDRQDLVRVLESRIFGAGNFDQLLAPRTDGGPEIEDIFITGWRNVFVKYDDGTKARVSPVCGSDEDLMELVSNLGAHEGLSARAWDKVNFTVTLRLPDGSRLHALQGVSRVPSISIRRHTMKGAAIKDLIVMETMTPELGEFITAAVKAKLNILLVGEGGVGKTTHLRAFARCFDPMERVITVERSLELALDEDTEAHEDCVALEEKLPNAHGVGAVTLRVLLEQSLRMRPDRVIVGEVLGDEAVIMLLAMTQGNDGSLSTIHANSAVDAIDRITTYAAMAPERWSRDNVIRMIASGLDLIVFLDQVDTPEGTKRKVAEVIEVTGISEESGQLLTTPLWALDENGMIQRTVAAMMNSRRMEKVGWDDTPGAGERTQFQHRGSEGLY